MTSLSDREAIWANQNEEFRDPAEIVGYWQDTNSPDPRLFEFETRGKWWETLEELAITLLVSREYRTPAPVHGGRPTLQPARTHDENAPPFRSGRR